MAWIDAVSRMLGEHTVDSGARDTWSKYVRGRVAVQSYPQCERIRIVSKFVAAVQKRIGEKRQRLTEEVVILDNTAENREQLMGIAQDASVERIQVYWGDPIVSTFPADDIVRGRHDREMAYFRDRIDAVGNEANTEADADTE